MARRMVVIRRELPRTSGACPIGIGRIGANEDSPFRVPLDRRPLAVMPLPLCLARYATWLLRVHGSLRSTVTPIAQMKPRSSRATAVTTCCLLLPRPRSRA